MHIELSAILPSLPHRRMMGQEAPHKATDLLGKVRGNLRGKEHDQGQDNSVKTAPVSSPNRLDTPQNTRRVDLGKQLIPEAAVVEPNAEQRLPDRGNKEKPSVPLLGTPFFEGIELPFHLAGTLTPAAPHSVVRNPFDRKEVVSSPESLKKPHRPFHVWMGSERGELPETAVPLIPSRPLLRMSGKPTSPSGERNLPKIPSQNEALEIAKDLVDRLRSHIEGEKPETSQIPVSALRTLSERGGVEGSILEWATQLLREGVPHQTVFHALRKLFEVEHKAETEEPSSITPDKAFDLRDLWSRIARGRQIHAFDNVEHVEHRENAPLSAVIDGPSAIEAEVEQESIEKPQSPRSENGIRHSMPKEISPNVVSPSTPESRAMPRIETRPLLNTVIERLREMLESKREKTITIQLNPPELGKLSVTVRTQGHRVETEIFVSNPDVRTILEANREQLVHALNDRGLHLGGMHIGSQANPHRETLPFSVTPVTPIWRQDGVSTAENLRPHSMVWFRSSGLDFSV